MPGQSHDTLTASELRTLEALLGKLGGRGAELPWPLFRFVTEVTATTNVDLLVEDEQKGVLLAWRDDPFGTGWHVPGSIIRHREEIAHRLALCAEDEFGCALDVADGPVALVQIFDDRGHSVSLCFRARLRGQPSKRIRDEHQALEAGDLQWFRTPPPGTAAGSADRRHPDLHPACRPPGRRSVVTGGHHRRGHVAHRAGLGPVVARRGRLSITCSMSLYVHEPKDR